jgi:phenylalanyl-tRNA synthetase beta chain
MGHTSTPSTKDPSLLEVRVPPSRPDIFHEVDLLEDVAIAFGINEVPKTFPQISSVGKPAGIEVLSDKVGREMAMRGWTEVKTLVLVSHLIKLFMFWRNGSVQID